MTFDLDKAFRLLDRGNPLPTGLIAKALAEIHGEEVSLKDVTRRMAELQQAPFSKLGRQYLWAPASVRLAFPELASAEGGPNG